MIPSKPLSLRTFRYKKVCLLFVWVYLGALKSYVDMYTIIRMVVIVHWD